MHQNKISICLGSGGWDRTNDQLINSQLHYRCATPEYSLLYHFRDLLYMEDAQGFKPQCPLATVDHCNSRGA